MATQPISQTLVPQQVDEVFPGIIREWFNDRQLVAYRLTRVSPTILDAWSEYVLTTLDTWTKERPYLALHDVSSAGVSLQYATLVKFDMMNIGVTNDGRLKAEEFFNQHRDFRARVAISFNLSVSGQVSQTVIDRLKEKHPSIQYKTFFLRDRALTWLAENLVTPVVNA